MPIFAKMHQSWFVLVRCLPHSTTRLLLRFCTNLFGFLPKDLPRQISVFSMYCVCKNIFHNNLNFLFHWTRTCPRIPPFEGWTLRQSHFLLSEWSQNFRSHLSSREKNNSLMKSFLKQAEAGEEDFRTF